MSPFSFSGPFAVFDLWHHVWWRLLFDIHTIFSYIRALLQKTYGSGQWLCDHRKLHFHHGHASHYGKPFRLWCKEKINVPFIFYEKEYFFQLQKCLWFLSAVTLVQMLAALSFKPLMPPSSAGSDNGAESKSSKSCMSQLINVNNWKNRKYVIWCLAFPSALFGYFVPYVHIVSI